MDIPDYLKRISKTILTSSAALDMFPEMIERYAKKEKEEHLKEWSKENPYIKKKRRNK